MDNNQNNNFGQQPIEKPMQQNAEQQPMQQPLYQQPPQQQTYQPPQQPMYQQPYQPQPPMYQPPYQPPYQQPYQQPYNQTPPSAGKGFSIASLICGIWGLVMMGILPAVLGIIFGCIGRSKSAAATGQPSKLATAGMICGIIGTFVSIIALTCLCSCLEANYHF